MKLKHIPVQSVLPGDTVVGPWKNGTWFVKVEFVKHLTDKATSLEGPVFCSDGTILPAITVVSPETVLRVE